MTALRGLAGCGLLWTLISVGCQDAGLSRLSGRVTIDGQPVEAGSIAFFPLDGSSSTGGAEIVAGGYEVRLAPGRYRVEVRVAKVVGQQKLYDTPDSPVQPVMEEVLPARYNDDSELTAELQPGKNQQDFELQSK